MITTVYRPLANIIQVVNHSTHPTIECWRTNQASLDDPEHPSFIGYPLVLRYLMEGAREAEMEARADELAAENLLVGEAE